VAACEEELVGAAARPTASARVRLAFGLLLLGGVTLLALRLDLPGFFDNEGRYAEVAREMVVSGDWVTPRLDGTLFLNKPPLTFWLTALVFRALGFDERARLVAVGAAALTLVATFGLGTLLYGDLVGLVAALALASMLGFVLEARTLRPDMLLTAAIAVALWCWQLAERGRTPRRGWLLAMWIALALGILDKGLVPLVVAGVPIVAVTVRDHGWRGLMRLRPLLGLAVIAVIVSPWHVAVALRHPGFAWDYVVNQHLLFYLDLKLPRDSDGDTLAFFWAAWAGRAIPWIVLVPLTLREGTRGATRIATAPARATFLLWAWTAGLLLFFSCSPSRLEHYSIPALPAAALLAARTWQRARHGDVPRAAWRSLAVLGAVVFVAGVLGAACGRELLSRTYWIVQVPVFLELALPAALTLVAGGALLAVAAMRRRPDAMVGVLALATVPVAAIVLGAEIVAEPLFSWRPLARALVAAVPRDVDVVFEAPEEYQLVAGLAYYAERPIDLLSPPGFVPPTYLARDVDSMFLARPVFERRWRDGERLAFVSDPQQRRDTPDGLVPSPFHVVGRYGDRWLLTSFAPASGG
jgi:4-amino-4-deoxy-L-arabinose transferase-like glycosyltransferase